MRAGVGRGASPPRRPRLPQGAPPAPLSRAPPGQAAAASLGACRRRGAAAAARRAAAAAPPPSHPALPLACLPSTRPLAVSAAAERPAAVLPAGRLDRHRMPSPRWCLVRFAPPSLSSSRSRRSCCPSHNSTFRWRGGRRPTRSAAWRSGCSRCWGATRAAWRSTTSSAACSRCAAGAPRPAGGGPTGGLCRGGVRPRWPAGAARSLHRPAPASRRSSSPAHQSGPPAAPSAGPTRDASGHRFCATADAEPAHLPGLPAAPQAGPLLPLTRPRLRRTRCLPLRSPTRPPASPTRCSTRRPLTNRTSPLAPCVPQILNLPTSLAYPLFHKLAPKGEERVPPGALVQWAGAHALCAAPEARRAFDILRQVRLRALRTVAPEDPAPRRPSPTQALPPVTPGLLATHPFCPAAGRGARGAAGPACRLLLRCLTLASLRLSRPQPGGSTCGAAGPAAAAGPPARPCSTAPAHHSPAAAGRGARGAGGPAAAAGGRAAEPPGPGVPAGSARVPGAVRPSRRLSSRLAGWVALLVPGASRPRRSIHKQSIGWPACARSLRSHTRSDAGAAIRRTSHASSRLGTPLTGHMSTATSPAPYCPARPVPPCSYAETVIHRIFYANNKLGDGRISWREFRRCAAPAPSGLAWPA